jgi:aspartyl-tRNA(Asn)/glutamyl-tRNA(Gln) amidotransferase subunit C
MSKLSVDEVKKLATLSSIVLSDAEVEIYRESLGSILGMVEALKNINTDGVEPTYSVHGLSNIDRVDEIKRQDVEPDGLLALSGKVVDGQIEVPKVL